MAARASAAVLTAVLPLLACSSSSSGRTAKPLQTPAVTPALEASLSPSPDPQSAVLAAWTAEHLAYADALRQLDPQLPALLETAVDPVLSHIRATIAVTRKQGLVAKGAQDLGTPQVTSLSSTSAQVESCVHDQLLLVSATTGKPARGIVGKPSWSLEHTTMKNISGVGWVVADNQIKQGTTRSVCSGH